MAACAACTPELLALPQAPDANALPPGIPGLREGEAPAQSLWLRLLFSALVDADFLDTEAYLNRGRSERRAEGGNTPARDFGACSVAFDDGALGAGEAIDAAPGVSLTRRC